MATFIQKIVGKVKGKVDDITLAQAITEINNAQQTISEKTNAIAYIQTEVGVLDQQMENLKKDREKIADKLSLVAHQNMAEEFGRIVG